MNEAVRAMLRSDAAGVAALHRSGIDTGFLSSLGPAFLKQLYSAIPSCPAGFGYVWQQEGGSVEGFIACAEDTGRLYRQALLRRGLLMALPLIRFVIRPSVIKRMVQTMRYPSEVRGDLPAAEVLSIAVSEKARGRGIGKALMAAATKEFARKGIGQIKVAVWAGNEPANRFYRRCGFDLALTREHHGLPMNIYVAQTSAQRLDL